MPLVYGTDPSAVPGHDHIADPPGAPDFNIAWYVVEVLWTPAAVEADAITHLTTDQQIQDKVRSDVTRALEQGARKEEAEK